MLFFGENKIHYVWLWVECGTMYSIGGHGWDVVSGTLWLAMGGLKCHCLIQCVYHF